MIKLENIHVIFNPGSSIEKRALRGIDLSISQGEFVTVIGGNGAGKSTVMGVISGVTPVTHGRILFDGRDVTKETSTQRSRDVARVFQDPLKGTCGALSIEENMSLALARGTRRGVSCALTTKKRRYFREQLAKLNLGVEERMQDPIGSLSGGQRQAISLIMAVLSPSKILLLDEHTAALDPRTTAFIIKLTQEIVEDKKLTTLMITHSMSQALAVGTRTVMLMDGRIAMDISGQERETLTPHDLVQRFEDLVLS